MGFKKGKPRRTLSIGLLDEVLEENHLVRLIDMIVEKIVPHLEEDINAVGKNKVGASAYDRTSLLKLFIYGYQNRINSSRALERETHRNLEVIWLMEDLRPDHKTISDFRKDHGTQIRQVLRQFNWFLKNKGYIEGKEGVFDGMKTKANTNRDTLSEQKIDKAIEKRLASIDRQVNKYLKILDLNDAIADKHDNLERLAIEEAKAVEQIAQLQQEVNDLLKKKAFLKNSKKKHVNFTDPDASLIKSRNGHMPQYNWQSSVCDKHKLIMFNYASEQVNDKKHLVEMTHRTEHELDVNITSVFADSDYFTTDTVEQLAEKGKEVYVAVSEVGQKKVLDENGQEVQFIYDAQKDFYRCSKGKELKLISDGFKNGRKAKRYQSRDCDSCPIRDACTSSKIGRSIYRFENAEQMQAYRKKMKTQKAKAMMKKRRCAVEHPFGTIRSGMMNYIPLLLRGQAKVQIEFDLYHLAYNFKRVCNIAGLEILHHQIEHYDWKAAAQAINLADQRRKQAQKQKKTA